MRRTAILLCFAAATIMSACQSDVPAPAGEPSHDQTDERPADTESHTAEAHDHEGHAEHEGEGLALRPIMQELGSNMAALTHAMWLEEYEQMAVHAADIAHHTHISEAETQRIRDELGDEMALFEEADEVVHVASERLHDAVESRDVSVILQRLHELQTGCMDCHTSFRERLRTDLTP